MDRSINARARSAKGAPGAGEARRTPFAFLRYDGMLMNEAIMALGETDLRRIGDYVKTNMYGWLVEVAPQVVSGPQILKRIERIEEEMVALQKELVAQRQELVVQRHELKAQRELMEARFKAVDVRFEDMNRRFRT